VIWYHHISSDIVVKGDVMSINMVRAFAKKRGACMEAREWLATQTDPRVAWGLCERPDWMIWYAGRRNVDRKVLVRIACECAKTALQFVSENENRPRLAIEVAERWIVGDAAIEEVRAAAAYTYADDAAPTAAYAAAATAYADDATATATYAAAYAAAAADDADDDADDDARKRANIQMCAIVRKHVSYENIAL
jgi:hypothetical protein